MLNAAWAGGRGMGGGSMGRGKVGDLARESGDHHSQVRESRKPFDRTSAGADAHRFAVCARRRDQAHARTDEHAAGAAVGLAATTVQRRNADLQQPSPERRDSIATARAVVQETIGNVRDNVSTAREKAYGMLSYPQRTRAQELEDKAEKVIAEEKEHEAGGGAAGGRSGRPPH